jgi:hypothetical protein
LEVFNLSIANVPMTMNMRIKRMRMMKARKKRVMSRFRGMRGMGLASRMRRCRKAKRMRRRTRTNANNKCEGSNIVFVATLVFWFPELVPCCEQSCFRTALVLRPLPPNRKQLHQRRQRKANVVLAIGHTSLDVLSQCVVFSHKQAQTKRKYDSYLAAAGCGCSAM